MKLTTTKSNLIRALTFASSGVATKSTAPALSHLLLKAEKDTITLTGTDMTIATTAKCQAEVSKSGTVCVPAALFGQFIKNAPDEQIVMDLSKRLTCQSGRAKGNIAILAAEEFPATHKVDGFTAAIPGDQLRNIISQVKGAASDDSSRFVLNSALFEFVKGRLNIVCTDGRRLHVNSLEVAGEGSFIVPTELVNTLHAALDRCSELVQCTFSDNSAKFTAADWSLVGKLIDGSYPNRKQVVPNDVSHNATVNTDALRSIVSRAVPFTTEAASAIKMEFTRKSLVVSAGNGDSEFSDSIDCESSVELKIGVDPNYFVGGLVGCGPVANIGLIDHLAPIVITEGTFTAVVMPMRVA